MKTNFFLLTLMSLFFFVACNKKDNPISPDNPDVPKDHVYKMSFTTTKSKGDIIKICLHSNQTDVWIDLNNDGVQDYREKVKVYSDDPNSTCSVEYTIASQDITVYGKVTEFDCSGNDIESLDVSNNPALKKLICVSNKLSTLNLSNNTALENLYINGNKLKQIDLSKNTALTNLDCGKNEITKLSLSQNKALKYLACRDNKFTSLDLSSNTALRRLYCARNKLSKLNLPTNGSLLYTIDCSRNELSELDISKNKNLSCLDISGNKISEKAKMQAIVDALPTLDKIDFDEQDGQDEDGHFWVLARTKESNKITKEQIKIARDKNWKVADNYGDDL